jgi:hypothetical protein
MPIALCALFTLAHSTTATAQTPDEPLVQSEEPGTIVTRLLVPAPEHEVRALLEDPEAFARFTPDVEGLEVQARGRCKLLMFDSRGLFDTLHYSTLRCPSERGWRETLFESEDFTRYDADMQLESVPGGTNIIYRLSVGLDLPVPDIVISRNVKRSAKLTMQAVREIFLRAAPEPLPSPPNPVAEPSSPQPLH